MQHLDLLMLTNGWRRFEWKKILNNEFATLKYPVETGLWIGGKVTLSDRKEPVKEGRVSLLIKGEDSTSIMAEAHLTDKGEFLVKDIFYNRKAAILYQGTNNKKEKLIVDVHLIPSHIDTLKRSAYRPQANLDTLDINNSRNTLASFLKGQTQLDTSGANYLGNVTVKAKRLSKEDSLNNEYTNGIFTMGKAIDPSPYIHYTTPCSYSRQPHPG